MSDKKKHESFTEHVVDTTTDIEYVDVGTAEDVEKLMRKYDRESNTRIWEGKVAVIVRAVMVIFSLYCIYSTLFSVAALEGFLLLPMNPVFRIATAVGGILMMIPGTFTDAIGIALFAAVLVIQFVQKKKAAAVA